MFVDSETFQCIPPSMFFSGFKYVHFSFHFKVCFVTSLRGKAHVHIFLVASLDKRREKLKQLPSRERSHILFPRHFWVDDFPFPQVGYVSVPWRVSTPVRLPPTSLGGNIGFHVFILQRGITTMWGVERSWFHFVRGQKEWKTKGDSILNHLCSLTSCVGNIWGKNSQPNK